VKKKLSGVEVFPFWNNFFINFLDPEVFPFWHFGTTTS